MHHFNSESQACASKQILSIPRVLGICLVTLSLFLATASASAAEFCGRPNQRSLWAVHSTSSSCSSSACTGFPHHFLTVLRRSSIAVGSGVRDGIAIASPLQPTGAGTSEKVTFAVEKGARTQAPAQASTAPQLRRLTVLGRLLSEAGLRTVRAHCSAISAMLQRKLTDLSCFDSSNKSVSNDNCIIDDYLLFRNTRYLYSIYAFIQSCNKIIL